MANGGSGNVNDGIRLILEEIRDLKREGAEFRKFLIDDRKQAAEDRKQAAEDRKEFRKFMQESREEAHQDRRDIREALVVIGKVGRKIIQTQGEHTRLLREIRDTLKRSSNGHSSRPGNGG